MTLQNKIKITYWDNQRWGNYQIRLNRLSDIERFSVYINGILRQLNPKITQPSRMSKKECERRWYVEKEHFDYLLNDVNIELAPAFVWSENTGGDK